MIPDYYLDISLQAVIDDCDLLTLCSAEPSSFAEANTEDGSGGVRIGSKATPSLSLVNGAVDGRAVRVAAFSDGAVEDTDAVGTGQWVALLDTENSRLIGTAPISNDQVVTDGNTFALAQFDFWNIRDPA